MSQTSQGENPTHVVVGLRETREGMRRWDICRDKAEEMRNSLHSGTLYIYWNQEVKNVTDNIKMVSGPLSKPHLLVALVYIHDSAVRELNASR